MVIVVGLGDTGRVGAVVAVRGGCHRDGDLVVAPVVGLGAVAVGRSVAVVCVADGASDVGTGVNGAAGWTDADPPARPTI